MIRVDLNTLAENRIQLHDSLGVLEDDRRLPEIARQHQHLSRWQADKHLSERQKRGQHTLAVRSRNAHQRSADTIGESAVDEVPLECPQTDLLAYALPLETVQNV